MQWVVQGLHACQTRGASAESGGAAQEAVKGKKALHSARQPPPHNVRQLSAKAASDYPPFVRADRHKGPVAAVVDFVIAGHRLKARRAAAARAACAERRCNREAQHCRAQVAVTRSECFLSGGQHAVLEWPDHWAPLRASVL